LHLDKEVKHEEDKKIGEIFPRVLMCGEPGVGKKSILSFIASKDQPTNNRHQTLVSHKGKKLTIEIIENIDFALSLLNDKKNEIKGLIYVIDSTDKGNIKIGKQHLERLIQCDNFLKIPFLVYTSKLDQKEKSIPPVPILEEIGLGKVSDLQWYIAAVDNIKGTLIKVGIEWMQQYF